MIKVLVLISFLLVVNNLYSQNILFSDSINYDNEQDSIEIFLRNFIAEKDSIKLQKYIQWRIYHPPSKNRGAEEFYIYSVSEILIFAIFPDFIFFIYNKKIIN